MDSARRRRIVRRGSLSFLVVIVLLAVTTGMAGLETHVQRQLRERIDRPTLAFVDLPEPLNELALSDLKDSVSELLASDWTDAQLCRTMATRLARVGWVEAASDRGATHLRQVRHPPPMDRRDNSAGGQVPAPGQRSSRPDASGEAGPMLPGKLARCFRGEGETWT